MQFFLPPFFCNWPEHCVTDSFASAFYLVLVSSLDIQFLFEKRFDRVTFNRRFIIDGWQGSCDTSEFSLSSLGTRTKYLKDLAYYVTDQTRDPAPSSSANRVQLLLLVMSASDK